MQDHFARGDWPTGVREGLAELTKEFGNFGRRPEDAAPAPGPQPKWAQEADSSGDPARDLERLLDRFRDDIRDAARDNGVTEDQLRTARQHLTDAASHIGAALRKPGE